MKISARSLGLIGLLGGLGGARWWALASGKLSGSNSELIEFITYDTLISEVKKDADETASAERGP